jgi:acyl carrier protein
VNEIQRQVREFISHDLGRTVSAVSDVDSLLESGILDSVGVLSLVGFLERKYAITIPDEELMPENLDTIDAIAAFVTRRRELEGGPR